MANVLKKALSKKPGKASTPSHAERVTAATDDLSKAEQAVIDARAKLSDSADDDAKALAQRELDVALKAVGRREGELEALNNVPADASEPGEGEQTFMVVSAIKHDGEDYEIDDTIQVDRATFDILKAAGNIVGDWKD